EICRRQRAFDASRITARSGTSTMYQKRNETVRYVLTAAASHGRALRKFGQTFIVLGYGMSQYANHGRPVWKMGKMPACTTAKSVIPSATRLIDVRHLALKSSKMAEMNVPAWPIPIHQTKLVIAKAQPTGMSTP